MLGYRHYAALKLDDTMAKTPQAVEGPAATRSGTRRANGAGEEAKALAVLIADEGRNHAVEPWDWRHYAEKLRQQKFDFSESELKPYLQLERIIEACFDVANAPLRHQLRGRARILPPGIPMCASSKCWTRAARSWASSSPIISPGPRSVPAPG